MKTGEKGIPCKGNNKKTARPQYAYIEFTHAEYISMST